MVMIPLTNVLMTTTTLVGTRKTRRAEHVLHFSLLPARSSDTRLLLTRAALLAAAASLPTGANAKRVCDPNGQNCRTVLSPGAIAAIVLTCLAVISLLIFAFLYIRRSNLLSSLRHREPEFNIEAGQIAGPSLVNASHVQPAYAASYDVTSAPPRYGYARSAGLPRSARRRGEGGGGEGVKTPSSQTYTTFTNIALKSGDPTTPNTPSRSNSTSSNKSNKENNKPNPIWGIVHGPSSAPQIEQVEDRRYAPPMTAPGNKSSYPFTGISSSHNDRHPHFETNSSAASYNSRSGLASAGMTYTPGQGMRSAGIGSRAPMSARAPPMSARNVMIPASAGIASAGIPYSASGYGSMGVGNRF